MYLVIYTFYAYMSCRIHFTHTSDSSTYKNLQLFISLSSLQAIIQLIRSLDSIKVPEARAMIIWMVGEYNSLGCIIPRMLTTVIKYLAHCFTSEATESKLQILNTAVKVPWRIVSLSSFHASVAPLALLSFTLLSTFYILSVYDCVKMHKSLTSQH